MGLDKAKKKKKGIQVGKEAKLFAYDIILYVENSQESTKTKKDLLELIYEEIHPMFLNQKTILKRHYSPS